MTAGPLGRVPPKDWRHVDRYPLTALSAAERPTSTPVIAGTNWPVEFDRPERDSQGRWWVGRHGLSGQYRGGHAYTLLPAHISDPQAWHAWFNQVAEGICVGEACARVQGLHNRVRYQPRWIYDRCKERDGYPGEGTYVSTGLDVLRDLGLVRAKPGERHVLEPGAVDGRRPDPAAGISANRWVRNMDDLLQVLGTPRWGHVRILNSWGTSYPRVVRAPIAVIAALHEQYGELGVVTDR